MTEQESAMKEINRELENLVDICRHKETHGKKRDSLTVKASLENFIYTVGQFIGCLPKQVADQVKERQEMAEKMVTELVKKLDKRHDGWRI